MFEIVLDGCRPKPLASYLKAIGILRILSEQKDPQARGAWRGKSFVVSTSLTLNELNEFFCNEYAPTPIISPWNGGSGFYTGDATDGMDAILQCGHKRFEQYREVISEVRSWPEIESFKTIRDVLAALNDALNRTGSVNEKKEIVGLLSGVEGDSSVLSDAIGKDILQMPIDEVEQCVNRKDIFGPSVRKNWWSVVKKARTKATALKRSEGKEKILPACRSRLPDSCVQWLDAVCAIQGDGKRNLNPLLGTGGNEGRFEFSNNFMLRISELFIKGDPAKTHDLFRSATLNANVSGLISASIGQYDPGRAGGYNQGAEIETKDFKINPWDFVLAMEGSLVMASAMVRRNPTEDRAWLTVPFGVSFSPVGFSSSSFTETGRKELWIPIWRNPAPYPEIKQLFSEGRASLGKRPAENGIEFSRAVGTLGVDRGIESFERYAFLMRRGKSYVALPAGRIKALYKPKLEVLNELDPITNTINGFFRAFKNVPASFGSARQNIEEAVFK